MQGIPQQIFKMIKLIPVIFLICLVFSGCISLPKADSGVKAESAIATKTRVQGAGLQNNFEIPIGFEQGDNVKRDDIDYGDSRQYTGKSINVTEQVDAVDWTKILEKIVYGGYIFIIALIVVVDRRFSKRDENDYKKWELLANSMPYTKDNSNAI